MKKNDDWSARKRNSIIKAKINQSLRINEEHQNRPIVKEPPKMNVNECLQKLRRQTEKLK